MSEITEEEYETAYKVLERVREDAEGVTEALLNDAHYQVQVHEAENK